MRFPKIADVAAELRQINKDNDADEDGIDVRLQVYPDGDWAVRWGSSDYDQDHRGYWGASSVPGGNRRLDSKDVARELIDQAKDQHAQGDEGLEERGKVSARASAGHRTMRSRRQPSLPGFPDMPDELEVAIPEDMPWTQIGGDMDPGTYGGLIATADGDHIELLEIQPVREYVGDGEAAEVGFPFWTKEAWFDLDALDLKNEEVQSALRSNGFDSGQQKEWFEEEASPTERAIAIAEALMNYGTGVDEGPSGWSKDLPDHEVKWSSGKTVNLREYIADEDDEFRREVLGEEDEEEDEEREADAQDILEGLGDYFKHEGHDPKKLSEQIARKISGASDSDKVDAILEEVNDLIDGHGIEAIHGDYSVDNYYHDIVALYVNMGDTYNTTLLYETENDRFLVTSWGDWVEHNERKYKIK